MEHYGNPQAFRYLVFAHGMMVDKMNRHRTHVSHNIEHFD